MSIFNPIDKQVAAQLKMLNNELKQTRLTLQAISKESANLIPDQAVKNVREINRGLKETKQHSGSIFGGVFAAQQLQNAFSFTKQYAKEAVSIGSGYWQGARGLQMQTNGPSFKQFGSTTYGMSQQDYNIASLAELNSMVSENVKVMGKWRQDQKQNIAIAQQLQKVTFGQVSLVDAGKIVEKMVVQLHASSTQIRANLATAMYQGRALGMSPADSLNAMTNQSYANRFLNITPQQTIRMQRLGNIASEQGVNIDADQATQKLYLDRDLVNRYQLPRGTLKKPTSPEALLAYIGKRVPQATQLPSIIQPLTGILPPDVQDMVYFYFKNKEELGKETSNKTDFEKLLDEASKDPATKMLVNQMKREGRMGFGSLGTLQTQSFMSTSWETVKDYLDPVVSFYNSFGPSLGLLIGPMTNAFLLFKHFMPTTAGRIQGAATSSAETTALQGMYAGTRGSAFGLLARRALLWKIPLISGVFL
jgi:hypothetical protein